MSGDVRYRRAVVDDIVMRWDERGDGVPVVLLHGIPTSPALWRHVLPRVDGRALAWEMVGYGESIGEGRGRDISLAAQARYLLRWLDHLGLDRVVLAGHDLGGGVAQICAVTAPERVAGLVLTNAVSYDSWPIPSVKLLRAAHGVFARMPPLVLRAILATLMVRGHDDRAQAAEGRRVHERPYLEHRAMAALARQARSLDVTDTSRIADRLSTLDVPAQIVWGAADQFQEVAYGERLAADLRAPLHRIEGGKHFTPEDHPQEVADAINAVVREVAGQR